VGRTYAWSHITHGTSPLTHIRYLKIINNTNNNANDTAYCRCSVAQMGPGLVSWLIAYVRPTRATQHLYNMQYHSYYHLWFYWFHMGLMRFLSLVAYKSRNALHIGDVTHVTCAMTHFTCVTHLRNWIPLQYALSLVLSFMILLILCGSDAISFAYIILVIWCFACAWCDMRHDSFHMYDPLARLNTSRICMIIRIPIMSHVPWLISYVRPTRATQHLLNMHIMIDMIMQYDYY